MITYHEAMSDKNSLDNYSNFMGDVSEIKDWFIVLSKTRDSGILAQSNFTVALELLGGESDTARVCRFGHWGVGWLELILVAPNSEAYKKAEEIKESLAQYPVLDEEHYCGLESNADADTWRDCYNNRERLAFIRERRNCFYFRDFMDLWQCVRGDFYCGESGLSER